MQQIARITGVLCITAYVMGLMMNMVQVSYTQKVIRLVVSVFILITIFSPINNFDSLAVNLSQYSDETAEVQNQSYETLKALTQQKIEENVKQRLDDKNISYEAVKVHIYEKEGTLELENIEIISSPQDKKSEIVQLLADIAKADEIIFGD